MSAVSFRFSMEQAQHYMAREQKQLTLIDSDQYFYDIQMYAVLRKPSMQPSTSTSYLQRVGFLAIAPALLIRRGVNAAEVLDNAGLEASALNDPESAIPYSAMGRFAELAAEKTRCPHFGLEIGNLVHLSSLGLVGRLMQNAPTLRVALQDLAAHHHRNSHGGVAYLLDDGPNTILGYAVYQRKVPGYKVISDGAALAAFNLISDLVGSERARECCVVISRTEPADPTPYTEAFRVPLHFNANQTGISFPRRFLALPIHGADVHLRSKLEEEVLTTFRAGPLDIVSQVRRAIRVGLMSSRFSATEIAAQLGIRRWTLDRELEACGLPFRRALEEARYELTKQLLANTGLSITDISTIVGYTDPSALTRSFLRWASITPSAWRQALNSK
jgi:AraC-like DNA-binding protein